MNTLLDNFLVFSGNPIPTFSMPWITFYVLAYLTKKNAFILPLTYKSEITIAHTPTETNIAHQHAFIVRTVEVLNK